MRPRSRFAAPFVIVTATACGQPGPIEAPARAPIEGMDYARDAEWARLDGGVVAPPPPVDAAPPYVAITDTTSPLRVTIVVPEYTEQPGGYVSCHNFGPHNRGCNPPRPVRRLAQRLEREVSELAAEDDRLLVIIATQPDDPVKRGLLVTAETPTMESRARVGSVREVDRSRVTLSLDLDEADVRADAHLEIHAELGDAARADARSEAPSLVPVYGEVIDIQRSDGATLVIVNRGTGDGVDRGWRLDLVDARDQPLRDGSSVLVKVTTRAAVAKVKLTPDQVKRALRVRLSPPVARR